MRTAAIALVLAVLAGACGNENQPADEPTSTTEFVPDTLPDRLLADFESAELGLRLEFPVDWLPDEDPAAGFVGFTAPPVTGDTFIENFNVVIVDLPDGITLSQYVAQDGLRLASSIADYSVTGGYEDQLAGAPASAVAFTGTIEGVSISVLRLLAIREGRGVEFTFLASSDEFENFAPVVDQLIASVALEAR